MTKNEIMEKLKRKRDFLPVDQTTTKIIIFEARGCDISTPNYKGDLFNHRLVSLIRLNGVNVVIEASATRTTRTTHAITGAELKHPKTFYDDNGLHVDFSVEDFPQFEKGWGFGYRSFPCSFHAGSKWIYNINDFKESAHTKKRLLCAINAELKTHFENILIINYAADEILTTDEALQDKYIRNFDKQPLKDGEYEKLLTRAADRWAMFQKLGIIPSDEDFYNNACWVSTSSLHGFYFPNSKIGIRCIAFGVFGRVICVLDE